MLTTPYNWENCISRISSAHSADSAIQARITTAFITLLHTVSLWPTVSRKAYSVALSITREVAEIVIILRCTECGTSFPEEVFHATGSEPSLKNSRWRKSTIWYCAQNLSVDAIGLNVDVDVEWLKRKGTNIFLNSNCFEMKLDSVLKEKWKALCYGQALVEDSVSSTELLYSIEWLSERKMKGTVVMGQEHLFTTEVL